VIHGIIIENGWPIAETILRIALQLSPHNSVTGNAAVAAG
jgi:hypothetical protein